MVLGIPDQNNDLQQSKCLKSICNPKSIFGICLLPHQSQQTLQNKNDRAVSLLCDLGWMLEILESDETRQIVLSLE